MTAYWLTTQWPCVVRTPEGEFPKGVYARIEHKCVLQQLEAGDRVLVYEYKTGPAEFVRRVRKPRVTGGQQIVATGIVAGSKLIVERPKQYGNDVVRQWCYCPLTNVKRRSGAQLATVLCVLKFKPGGNLRSIGLKGSGIRELTKDQFDQLAP